MILLGVRKLRSLTCRGGAKWKGARALPDRIGEDGVAATTAQEVSGVVLRHFAAIEAAEVCSVESLADRHGRSRSSLVPGAVRDIKYVIWLRCGDCLPARGVARPVVLMGCVMTIAPSPLRRWLRCSIPS